MANYKYQEHLRLSDDDAFDRIHGASTRAPHSGIYRCDGCDREIVAQAATLLPPQDDHEHNPTQGPVQWRLIVYTSSFGA